MAAPSENVEPCPHCKSEGCCGDYERHFAARIAKGNRAMRQVAEGRELAQRIVAMLGAGIGVQVSELRRLVTVLGGDS